MWDLAESGMGLTDVNNDGIADDTVSVNGLPDQAESSGVDLGYTDVTGSLSNSNPFGGLVDSDGDFNGIIGEVDFRTIQDNDKDGIPDYYDLDDDNDGILDMNENLECSGFAEYSNSTVGVASVNTSVDGNFWDGTSFSITESSTAISILNVDELNSTCYYSGSNFTHGESNTDNLHIQSTSGSSTITINFNQAVSNVLLHIDGLDRRKLTISGITGLSILSANSQAQVNGFEITDVDASTFHNASCADQNGSIEGTFYYKVRIQLLFFIL